MATYGNGAYGAIAYADLNEISDDQVAALTPNLMDYLPRFYSDFREAEAIQGASAQEIGRLRYSIDDLLAQFYVETATWGLAFWEERIGIETDATKPIEQRRSVVKSRLRGYGTTSRQMLKDVAAAYSGGEVEIIEYAAEHRFVVKFVGVGGIPPNMADLTATIELIKPAHLAFEFAYTFLTWAGANKYTWTEVSGMTWNELRERVDV